MGKFNKPSGGNRSGKGERKGKDSVGPKKSFSKDRPSGDGKKRRFKSDSAESGKKTFRSFGKESGEKRRFKTDSAESGKKSYRSFDKKDSGNRDFKEKRSFNKEGAEKRRFKPDSGDGEKKPYRSFDKKEGGSYERKSFRGNDDKKSFPRKKPSVRRDDEGESEEKLSYKQKRSFSRNKELRSKDSFKKDESHHRPFNRNDKYSEKKSFDKNRKSAHFEKEKNFEKKPFKKKFDEGGFKEQKRVKHDEFEEGKSFSESFSEKSYAEKKPVSKNKSKSKESAGTMRLNKYLAHAGIASRREADTLIKSGVVKVNGVPVTEMGFKVNPGDTVTYGDSAVKSERKVYLLLNKPKDYITTVDDPQERKTVMELIKGACKERVYPVGRLDRNTTGLLLFTNDGELTKKLTHPRHEIKKVYQVSLNKGLKQEDFQDILSGIELEDGPIKADDLAFVGEGKKEIGIEIHSGRNRIVRRIFEHLGYEVIKLDRITFAGLTKKDLPRGKYRFLTQKEVGFLHMIG